MMRYQRVSPDCLPLTNGRKPGLRTVKEDDHPENGRIPNFSGYDGKTPRVRSAPAPAALNPSTSQDHHFPHFVLPTSDPSAHHHENHTAAKGLNHRDINDNSPSRGGDVLLQWGHKKRSRGSRAESRAAGDEPSSAHARQAGKMQRRSSFPGVDKQAAAAMPPPGAGYSRGANLRPCSSVRDSMGSSINRNAEERSGSLNRSEKRSPPSPLDKVHKMAATCTAVANGLHPAVAHDAENMASTPSSDAGASGGDAAAPVSGATATVTKEKLNLDLFEWPRIYISLSRKEKEDDFLAMKGTKLPQRPKKRAKNIDKTLQYLFPGMWLSDLTRGRYEVREKKSVKKVNTMTYPVFPPTRHRRRLTFLPFSRTYPSSLSPTASFSPPTINISVYNFYRALYPFSIYPSRPLFLLVISAGELQNSKLFRSFRGLQFNSLLMEPSRGGINNPQAPMGDGGGIVRKH